MAQIPSSGGTDGVALLIPSNLTSGYDGDPNDAGAPDELKFAPFGTQYYSPTLDIWHRKRGVSSMDWEVLESGEHMIIDGDITQVSAVDWDLPDNDSEALSFDSPGHAGLLVFDTTNGAEQVRIGATADSADFPNARMVVSKADSGLSLAAPAGLIVEAVADGASGGVTACLGYAETNGSDLAVGVRGLVGRVDTNDTGTAYALWGQSTFSHVGGENVGARLWAMNSSVANIALQIQAGDFETQAALDWDLADNQAEALSFDSPGHAGLLVFDTTNGSEQVRIGATAESVDFPNARVIISQEDTGDTSTALFGFVGESVSTSTVSGVGIRGVGLAVGAQDGFGIQGNALAGATDTAAAVGVLGTVVVTHNGPCVGARLAAFGGTENLALDIQFGDIKQSYSALKWFMIDNQAEALSFDSPGQAGILEIDTTNGAEGVRFARGIGAWGVALPASQPAKINDVSETAGASYTSNEQDMLNSLKAKLAAVIDVLEGAGLSAAT